MEKIQKSTSLSTDSPLVDLYSLKGNPWVPLLLKKNNPKAMLFPFCMYLEKIFHTIKAGLSNIIHAINDEELRLIIIKNIYEVLYKIIQRPLVWEFTVLNEKQTEKISFLNFLKNLSKPAELSIFLKKYPVVQELLLNIVNNNISFYLEFFIRLKADFVRITALLNTTEVTLIHFEQLGDSHCRGRKTLLLTLKKTGTLNSSMFIIYKPRPVTLDKKFQELLKFVNSSYEKIFFKATKIIDMKNYGWVEFIEHTPIKKGYEEKFYYRLGYLLGLIYSLNGLDMHFENIIAHGDQPVLIDLECLFSMPINEQQFNEPFWPKVHETAIIPNLKKDNHIHYDFSTLLFHCNQTSPNTFFELIWCDEYNVKIARKTLKIKPAKNNPYYQDFSAIELSPLHYKPDIISGFKAYYTFILKNKEAFSNLIKTNFTDCVKRVIFRATLTYDKLMIESYHPKLLSNKQHYLDYLNQINRHLKKGMYHTVSLSEKNDILQGDIPYFFSYIAQKNILNSKGEIISYVYPQTAFERVLKKIKLLDKNDLIDQCQLISQSLEENYVL